MVLPDQDANKPLPLFGLMHLLPDAVTRVLLTRWGRGIIGSEKTTRPTKQVMLQSPLEVAGLQTVPCCTNILNSSIT